MIGLWTLTREKLFITFNIKQVILTFISPVILIFSWRAVS